MKIVILLLSILGSSDLFAANINVKVEKGNSEDCEAAILTFEEPIFASSLQGQLYLKTKFGQQEILIPKRIGDRVFSLQLARKSKCSLLSSQHKNQLIMRDEVVIMPPSPTPIISTHAITINLNEIAIRNKIYAISFKPIQGAQGNLVSNTVDQYTLESAFKSNEEWKMSQPPLEEGDSDNLRQLDIDGSIIVPRGSQSRKHHYGKPLVNFIIRDSIDFVEALFSDLEQVGVADITTQEGETPHVEWPNGDRTYLHPNGSHQGDDVDIGYISEGPGNDRNAKISIEKNFWLLYALLSSEHVELIYSSLKDDFISYAQEARKMGLITEQVVAIFKSARVIKSLDMNHDTHLHVKTRARRSGFVDVVHDLRDNMYLCGLALRSDGASSEKNFCASSSFRRLPGSRG